jgi:uncharacterized protein
MGREKITNLSSGKSVEEAFENASSASSRMRGLMFRKKCIAILFDFNFDGIWPIHSFFVPFEFDAVYLDGGMKAVEILEDIKPFQAYIAPRAPSRFLLEMPAGFARRLGVKIGDMLKIG